MLVSLNTDEAKFAISVWRFSQNRLVLLSVVYITNNKIVERSIVWELLITYSHTHNNNIDECGNNPQSA